jgi:hypothetical protein
MRDRDDCAGDKRIAAKRAARRQSQRQQREQRHLRERGAGAQANLADVHGTEQAGQPVCGPALQPDGHALQPEDRKPGAGEDHEHSAAASPRRHESRSGTPRQRRQDRPQPPAPMIRRQ